MFASILAVTLASCEERSDYTSAVNNQVDMLSTIQNLEADEAAVLFFEAKEAAVRDDVKQAELLLAQAIGRGAGIEGKAEVDLEISKAVARIAERKRIAEVKRKAASHNRTVGQQKLESEREYAQSQFNTVTVKVNVAGSGISEKNLKLLLNRPNITFSNNNGKSSEVQIYKALKANVGGRYSYRIVSTYRQSALHESKYKTCSGYFNIDGKKPYVQLNISSDCSVYVN